MDLYFTIGAVLAGYSGVALGFYLSRPTRRHFEACQRQVDDLMKHLRGLENKLCAKDLQAWVAMEEVEARAQPPREAVPVGEEFGEPDIESLRRGLNGEL